MTEIANFWDGNHPLTEKSNGLYDDLVPDEGNCGSLQGELLRASTKISWDWFNNGWGCNNWSGAVIFLREMTAQLPNRPAVETMDKLANLLSYAYEYSHGQPAPRNEERAEEVVTGIHEIIVQAIIDNPELVPNIHDMYDFSEEDYEHSRWNDEEENIYF